MHPAPLLVTITAALVVAFLGGMAARRAGLPTILGYLLAGIAIGPFTPGFVGDPGTLRQMAELGVVFLLFGVGLHFSFADLWRVRDVAVPGAIVHTVLATLMGAALTRGWGWPLSAAILFGLSVSVASTVVLLRGLMDRSLLNTTHGQAAVGWLVMEDILSVLILLLLPAMVPSPDGIAWGHVAATVLKAVAFLALMLLAGARLLPWLLERVAHTRSRELFVLGVLAITLGTTLAASALFGVSMALGAFVAGAIVSRSPLSHQVGADLFPFREAFSVLFFVSIGILVNPAFLWEHRGQVLAVTLLVVVAKSAVVVPMGLFSRRPARTFLVIAVGMGQIGEFSFILGQGGLSLGLLEADQYSLLLAGALTSITLNPFLFALLPGMERTLRRLPGFWRKLEAGRDFPEIDEASLAGHVVIVGFGRVGKHLVEVLEPMGIALVVVESDLERVEALNRRGIPTLYGDASNSEVITHARLSRARALVVTVPEDTTAAVIVKSARDLNPDLPIVARAGTEQGLRQLVRSGAAHVVHPELEGGLELVHHALLVLGFPVQRVHEYAEAVRRDRYDPLIGAEAEEYRSLRALLSAAGGMDLSWMRLDERSPLAGRTLAEANLRSRTGASVVTLMREGRLIPNPKSMETLRAGDRIGLIGEAEQIQAARALVEGAPAPP